MAVDTQKPTDPRDIVAELTGEAPKSDAVATMEWNDPKLTEKLGVLAVDPDSPKAHNAFDHDSGPQAKMEHAHGNLAGVRVMGQDHTVAAQQRKEEENEIRRGNVLNAAIITTAGVVLTGAAQQAIETFNQQNEIYQQTAQVATAANDRLIQASAYHDMVAASGMTGTAEIEGAQNDLMTAHHNASIAANEAAAADVARIDTINSLAVELSGGDEVRTQQILGDIEAVTNNQMDIADASPEAQAVLEEIRLENGSLPAINLTPTCEQLPVNIFDSGVSFDKFMPHVEDVANDHTISVAATLGPGSVQDQITKEGGAAPQAGTTFDIAASGVTPSTTANIDAAPQQQQQAALTMADPMDPLMKKMTEGPQAPGVEMSAFQS